MGRCRVRHSRSTFQASHPRLGLNFNTLVSPIHTSLVCGCEHQLDGVVIVSSGEPIPLIDATRTHALHQQQQQQPRTNNVVTTRRSTGSCTVVGAMSQSTLPTACCKVGRQWVSAGCDRFLLGSEGSISDRLVCDVHT
jgi:hypothetical protein